MIKVIIIDDEPLGRSIIKEYLKTHSDFAILDECNDGYEGVKSIMHHKPDLIFLDIQMPKINGFEMLELIDESPDVIFTTAYEEYAIKAFEARAIDYLLKPFSKARFDDALEKVRQNKAYKHKQNESGIANIAAEELSRIVVKTANNIRIIPVSEIKYFEAYDDYVKIHTSDGIFIKKKTMQEFENSLDSKMFVRAHRSYIIQLTQITRIEIMEKDKHLALLIDGTRIPLSRTGYLKLKEKLDI